MSFIRHRRATSPNKFEYRNVYSTNHIDVENTDKQTKIKYFDKLLSLSQVGLVANPAQTETAEFALMKLKDEIVLVEGKRIKNHYMKYLGIDA